MKQTHIKQTSEYPQIIQNEQFTKTESFKSNRSLTPYRQSDSFYKEQFKANRSINPNMSIERIENVLFRQFGQMF